MCNDRLRYKYNIVVTVDYCFLYFVTCDCETVRPVKGLSNLKTSSERGLSVCRYKTNSNSFSTHNTTADISRMQHRLPTDSVATIPILILSVLTIQLLTLSKTSLSIIFDSVKDLSQFKRDF